MKHQFQPALSRIGSVLMRPEQTMLVAVEPRTSAVEPADYRSLRGAGQGRAARTGLIFCPQAGFSLVEVLVSLLILSLGLLGLAAMQVFALRNTQSAHLRSLATLYAYDMLDRMRAHRDLARVEAFDLQISAPPPICVPTAYNPAICNLAQWRAALANLPDGTGAVDYNPATELATVTVQWRDKEASGMVQIQLQSQI